MGGLRRNGKRLIKSMAECAKKIFGIPIFAANGVAVLELGRDSR
jgi:hypothetical protein